MAQLQMVQAATSPDILDTLDPDALEAALVAARLFVKLLEHRKAAMPALRAV